VQSTVSLDFPVVQAITAVVVVNVYLINTATDLLQHRLDPRLRHRQALAGDQP
jgi:ABC-type dipeptide/oligopeptide/nickel transport system permease component